MKLTDNICHIEDFLFSSLASFLLDLACRVVAENACGRDHHQRHLHQLKQWLKHQEQDWVVELSPLRWQYVVH